MMVADDAALAAPLLESAAGAHVVGHSYGAVVAMKLAMQHPQLVHSLIGYEPVLFRLLFEEADRSREAQEARIAVNEMRDNIAQGDNDAAARIFVDFWSGAGSWQALPASHQQSISSRMATVLRHFAAVYSEAFPRQQFARPGIPMLFLSGALSVPVARCIGQLLLRALPFADHQELPGMGHMGPLTHSAQVNDRIRQFLYARVVDRTPEYPERIAALPGKFVHGGRST